MLPGMERPVDQQSWHEAESPSRPSGLGRSNADPTRRDVWQPAPGAGTPPTYALNGAKTVAETWEDAA
jgi:hypothetical protein